MGTSRGLASQEAAGWVSRLVWNWTGPFLRSQPWQLAGYLDLLLTVVKTGGSINIQRLKVMNAITISDDSESNVEQEKQFMHELKANQPVVEIDEDKDDEDVDDMDQDDD